MLTVFPKYVIKTIRNFWIYHIGFVNQVQKSACISRLINFLLKCHSMVKIALKTLMWAGFLTVADGNKMHFSQYP